MSDKPHDILRKARLKKGYRSAEAAARAYGWNVATYRSHENGGRGVRGIPTEAAKRYAATFNIPIAQLINVETGPSLTADVEMVGEAAFGVWRSSTLGLDQNDKKITLSVPMVSAEGKMRFAIKVADESVNRLIPAGQFVIFVAVTGTPKNNALVVVERVRGDLVERSVRRYVESPKPKLVSYSHSPLYQETLYLSERQQSGEVVRIVGLIVGTHAEYPDGLIVG